MNESRNDDQAKAGVTAPNESTFFWSGLGRNGLTPNANRGQCRSNIRIDTAR